MITKITNIAQLRTRKGTTGALVETLGYYTPSDGGGNVFQWDSSSVLADNGGSVIAVTGVATGKWIALNSSEIRIKQFGAVGSNASSDRDAINRAITFALAQTNIPTVIIDKGVWYIEDNAVYLNVPLNKTLKILGEKEAIIDFKCNSASPYGDSKDSVFRTSNSYTDPVSWTSRTLTYGTITIENVSFTGNRMNPYPSSYPLNSGNKDIFARCLLFRGCQQVNIKDCNFSNIPGTAIGIVGSSGGDISGNTFKEVFFRRDNSTDEVGDGVTLYHHCENFRILNNYMDVLSTNTSTITNQYGRCGIAVDYYSRNTVVSNNTIVGYERGIHVEKSSNVVVSSNTIRRSPIAALSSQNDKVQWIGNSLDSKDAIIHPNASYRIAAAAVFFAYEDNDCVYSDNYVQNWYDEVGTYLGKFWGNNLLIKQNVFTQETSTANIPQVEISGYPPVTDPATSFPPVDPDSIYTIDFPGRKNYQILENVFKNGVELFGTWTLSYIFKNNIFYGGRLINTYSHTSLIENNVTRPKSGQNTGKGMYLAESRFLNVYNNRIYNSADVAITNNNSVSSCFEGNLLVRTKSGGVGAGGMFGTSISGAEALGGMISLYPNIIRDFITGKTYKVGHSKSEELIGEWLDFDKRFQEFAPVLNATTTLNATHGGQLLSLDSVSAFTIKIPPDLSNTIFPVGTQIDFVQIGDSDVTITTDDAVNVIIRSVGDKRKIAAKWGKVSIVKRYNFEWYLYGDLKI